MGPKPANERTDHDLFLTAQLNLISQHHGLVRFTALIDWHAFDAEWSTQYVSTTRQPALLYRTHLYKLNDELVFEEWREKPNWQRFSGEQHLRHELPCDPPSLLGNRQLIGVAGCEWLLAYGIETARKDAVIIRLSLGAVAQNTTAQPKIVARSTGGHLFNCALEQAGQNSGIGLRQCYARIGNAAKHQAGRYVHAKQFGPMQYEIRKLLTRLYRVVRAIPRKVGKLDAELKAKLDIATWLRAKTRGDKRRLYALYASGAGCIAKGKVRTPYKFDVKVSMAATAVEARMTGMHLMSVNLYVGQAATRQLEQIDILTNQAPNIPLADRGFRGVQSPEGAQQLISHTRRLQEQLKDRHKRLRVAEPSTGHMKSTGTLARTGPLSTTGYALRTPVCGGGNNLSIIQAHPRLFLYAFAPLLALAARLLLSALCPPLRPQRA